MTELVERYVHQVGRYLSQKERAEVEAELRSQIEDQLEDRYAGAPSQAEVASVLTELGDPRQIAASYGGEQYLVGPNLYPFMMMVLRRGWLIVPAIVVFLNIFGLLVSGETRNLIGLLIETSLSAIEATLIFSAVVVLIFAIVQRSGLELEAKAEAFNPLNLPDVDDPGVVDRFEAAFGIAFGTFVILILLYFLRVGGLTLRFNLSDPGEVIPIPPLWTVLLIIAGVAMIVLHLWALRRNRWSVWTWLGQTLLEVFGAVCLFFVLYQPLLDPILAAVPALNNIPSIEQLPALFVIISAVSTLVTRGSKGVRLWNYRSSPTAPFAVQADG